MCAQPILFQFPYGLFKDRSLLRLPHLYLYFSSKGNMKMLIHMCFLLRWDCASIYYRPSWHIHNWMLQIRLKLQWIYNEGFQYLIFFMQMNLLSLMWLKLTNFKATEMCLPMFITHDLGFRQNNVLFPGASYKKTSFIHSTNILVNLTGAMYCTNG